MAVLPNVEKMTSEEKELLSELSCQCADAKMRLHMERGKGDQWSII